MSDKMELWLRPWAFYAPQHRYQLSDESTLVVNETALALVRYDDASPPALERQTNPAEKFIDVSTAGGQKVKLALIPFPLRPGQGLSLQSRTMASHVVWPNAPDRPRERGWDDPDDPGIQLMQRARAVWDRIQDVEEALEDPATLWQKLRDRWTGADPGMPQMHVIVRQARSLRRVIDVLERRPRKVLRRVQKLLPVGRVQEIDRRSMLWLARQPGERLAEKAGEKQRVQGVAREENFDTLENRVLRAYSELAARVARDYLARNRTKRLTQRAIDVERFMRRCQRLGRELRQVGVRLAEPGITPNFVLQQNLDYRAVWDGWKELINQDRLEDDLWRWQALSWAEYCMLSLMVALIGVPGAQVVATSPIWFRDEQRRGSWIESDSPIGVVYLPAQELIIEVANTRDGRTIAQLGARIVMRLRRAGDPDGFAAVVPVWPLWAEHGGLSTSETAADMAELNNAFQHHIPNQLVRGALIMRPANDASSPEFAQSGLVAALALGTDGAALSETLRHLTNYLQDILRVEVA
jgi:histone H3/H4